MKKKIYNKPVTIYQDVEMYETEDGEVFENEQDAIEYEKIDMIKKKDIVSDIINNSYLIQYIGTYKFVYFKNANQVKAYEQKMCNGGNNTWMSWISCKEKFKFPCWMMCYYVPHRLSETGENDYTAVYMTPEEVVEDLYNVINQIKKL